MADEKTEITEQTGATETETSQEEQTEKLLSQSEVNKLVGGARKDARAVAVKELSEQLGCTVEEAKSIIDQHRQAQEDAKTELEKEREAKAAAERERDEARREAATVRRQSSFTSFALNSDPPVAAALLSDAWVLWQAENPDDDPTAESVAEWLKGKAHLTAMEAARRIDTGGGSGRSQNGTGASAGERPESFKRWDAITRTPRPEGAQ